MPFLNRPQPALILFLALFTSQAGFLVLTPILPDVARELGVSTATAGGLRIASGLAGGAVALTLGVAGRRLGLRDLIAAGLLLIGARLGHRERPRRRSRSSRRRSSLSGAGNAIVLSGARGRGGPLERAGRAPARAVAGRCSASRRPGSPACRVIGALAGSSWRLAMCVPLAASAVALAVLADPPARRPGRRARRDAGRCSAATAPSPAGRWASCSPTPPGAGRSRSPAALMIESYGSSPALVGLLLAAAAAAYFPGNLLARRRAGQSPRRLLALLGSGLAVALAVFGAVRPGLWFSVALFARDRPARRRPHAFRQRRRSRGGPAGRGGRDEHPRRGDTARHGRSARRSAARRSRRAATRLLGVVLSILFAAGAVPHLAALRLPAITHPHGPVPATEGGHK